MALIDVKTAAARLTELVDGLDETTARGDSLLPGWTRGHLITHVANFSYAFTRQVEYALRGELVEVYDGGRPARNAAIDAGADRPAAVLVEDLSQAVTGLLAAWDRVGPDDWSRPISHRNSTLAHGIDATWRELEIHTSDLGLGATPDEWPATFCAHLLDFLRPRTPKGVHLVLQPSDGPVWEDGTGEERVLTGTLTSLTAWYAGRPTTTPVEGPEPELLPYP
ncbi:maleylpyruvate isomerase family mycothiol-dependent enzyme [Kribbella antibiotica]|uniref:Maleylpyruvate isomerase family mycothiol-dependent enzyme n=1 Tax=Kribbella antibiotica TaxID=190195 RepID=A0A4R4YUR1_9ACTN|nr:maleylpyruvate isomerase family mycothiol-dependent enzyme [Kribbella antibiotica]TDD49111.1 maleylpyruvate isomerase family mycothiol-dependent enzyme [Kribbella antibiotica]